MSLGTNEFTGIAVKASACCPHQADLCHMSVKICQYVCTISIVTVFRIPDAML